MATCYQNLSECSGLATMYANTIESPQQQQQQHRWIYAHCECVSDLEQRIKENTNEIWEPAIVFFEIQCKLNRHFNKYGTQLNFEYSLPNYF